MVGGKDLRTDEIAVITSLYKAGKSNKEISVISGIKLRTVQTWTKKIKDSGTTDPPTHKKRPGKARLTSLRALRIIKRELETNPRLSARQIKEQNHRILGETSTRTVRRMIHNLGYRWCRPRKKPDLTLKNVQDRVRFCKRYLAWDETQWKNVLWSDEAIFTVTSNRGGNVYRRRGSDPLDLKYVQRTVKFPDSVMVWGCFGYHGVGDIVFLPKNQCMNSERYVDLLVRHLGDSFEKTQCSIFMHDGAPCHRAKIVKEWLEACEVEYFYDWPGNSPDLNPLENLWSIMKQKLRGRDTSSIPKLKDAILDIWQGFSPEMLHSLAISVPHRLQVCHKAKGKVTKY